MPLWSGTSTFDLIRAEPENVLQGQTFWNNRKLKEVVIQIHDHLLTSEGEVSLSVVFFEGEKAAVSILYATCSWNPGLDLQ